MGCVCAYVWCGLCDVGESVLVCLCVRVCARALVLVLWGGGNWDTPQGKSWRGGGCVNQEQGRGEGVREGTACAKAWRQEEAAGASRDLKVAVRLGEGAWSKRPWCAELPGRPFSVSLRVCVGGEVGS